MTTQHPTQPGWQPQQPTPPPRRRNWLHGLAILTLAALGTIIGGMAGSAFVVLNYGAGTALMLAGMCLGLFLGLWFGYWVTSSRRRPIDPDRYPNRLISMDAPPPRSSHEQGPPADYDG